MFGLIIDTKVIGRRKYILVLFGLSTVVAQTLIFTKIADEAGDILALLILQFGSVVVLDATIDSMSVQQARAHKRGQ